MSDTQMTDRLTGTFYFANAKKCPDCCREHIVYKMVSVDDASKLERELAAAQAEVERLRGMLGKFSCGDCDRCIVGRPTPGIDPFAASITTITEGYIPPHNKEKNRPDQCDVITGGAK